MTGKRRKLEINEEARLAIDICETDDKIIVLAQVAGTQLENLSITATEDVLTIKGERKFHKEINEMNYISRECFWGKFSRSIVLPENADTKKIEATLKDSVLKITIAKKPEEKEKTIRIRIDE